MPEPLDTIIAPATPALPAARGIVRISGPRAWAVALHRSHVEVALPRLRLTESFDETASCAASLRGKLCCGASKWSRSAAESNAQELLESALAATKSSNVRPDINRHQIRTLLDTNQGPVPCLILLFRGPNTATGEDTAEIHLPGNPVLIEAVSTELAGTMQCRLAGPGEFSRRAWENGKISLLQAEAVMALVAAGDRASAQAAGQLLDGAWSRRVGEALQRLEHLCARMELSFDFDDEASAQSDEETFLADLSYVRSQIAPLCSGPPTSNGLPMVVLAGPPNAGKSTLFNALCGRVAAATSEEAGTTRDAVTAKVDLGGRMVTLVDTAGVDETAPVEGLFREASAVTNRWIDAATIVLECRPAGAFKGASAHSDDRKIWVATMADLCPATFETDALVSARLGTGLETLRQMVASRLAGLRGTEHPPVSARMSLLMKEAMAALHDAEAALSAAAPPEVVSSLCRSGMASIRDAMGQGASADVLDAIFAGFCIGK